MSKKSVYKDVKDGVPTVLEYRRVKGQRVANMNCCCCDCGLVHNIAYVPLKTRINVYMWRDNRRTANRRRSRSFRESASD